VQVYRSWSEAISGRSVHTFKFERLKGLNPFLAVSQVSLADCYLAPIFGYLTMTPDAGALLQATPGLSQWWEQMSQRPAMQKTPPQFG
jgi:glutathione S-transferase